jgi:hypothetical protein
MITERSKVIVALFTPSTTAKPTQATTENPHPPHPSIEFGAQADKWNSLRVSTNPTSDPRD